MVTEGLIMPDRRRLPSREDAPSTHKTGRWISANLSRLVFIGLFVFFASASVAASSVWLAAAAAIFLFQFAVVALPVEEIRDYATRLKTGEAGEQAYDATVSRMDRLKGWFR